MFRKHKATIVLLVLLAVIFTANHIEYAIRSRKQGGEAKQGKSVVVSREGSYLGHDTIGINEASLPVSDGSFFLRFSLLEKWNYQRDKGTDCPDSIKELDGKKVSCAGFMYPLEAGSEIKTFCLLRSTQTCCYGPRPQYNQYLLVESPKPIRFERLAPIIVEGRFFVDPKPDEGYIYRMEAASISKESGGDIVVDAVEAARKAGYPLFDFSEMKNLEKDKGKTIPPALLELDKKTVVIEGFVAGRADKSPRSIVLSSVLPGSAPPTAFNAVMVFPDSFDEMPPVWKEKEVFTGILTINQDPAQFSQKGIISLNKAVRGVKNPNGFRFLNSNGPIIPISDELVILGLVLGGIILKSFVRKKEMKNTVTIFCFVLLALLMSAGCSKNHLVQNEKSTGSGNAAGSSNEGQPNTVVLAPAAEDAKQMKQKRSADLGLLKRFLNKEKIVVDDATINREIEKLRKDPPQAGCICCRYPTLGAYMEANYLTLDDLKELIAVKYGFRQYLEREWQKEASDPRKVKAFLTENRKRIKRDYVKVSHIFFNTFQSASPDENYDMLVKEKKQLAETTWKKLNDGESFDSLAAHFSDDAITSKKGGDLGCVSNEMFGPKISKSLAEMKPGSYSAPLESPWGFHIFRKGVINDDDIIEIHKEDFIKNLQDIIIAKVQENKF
jgi:parvulin-like peptidyl-prolyl isomerase